jgi:glutathione peroxidase
LAFPCNQFGKQEPGTNEEIYQNITQKYGVKFPMMSKIEVNGKHTHPVYAYLRNHSELVDASNESVELIPWNFAKFFVNRNGKVIKYFHPKADLDLVVNFTREEMEK